MGIEGFRPKREEKEEDSSIPVLESTLRELEQMTASLPTEASVEENNVDGEINRTPEEEKELKDTIHRLTEGRE